MAEQYLKTDLSEILDKLEESSERPIGRRNARSVAAGFVVNLQNHIQNNYPPISKPKSDTARATHITCPDCHAIRCSSFTLVQHIMSMHSRMIGIDYNSPKHGLRCVCGKTFKGKTGLAAHLSYQHRIGTLESHWATGTTTMFLEGKL
jgi:hypothetical protein